MAKRSDFAQKLLDDLRVRKEKMGASQSSNRSNSMAIDAYAYSKQAYRGRGDARTSGTIGSRGSSRTPIIQDGSNQIVAYGRGGRSSQQMGDLSMALAFALENGGKFGRADTSSRSSMLGFLNQIGRGAMEFSKMERKGRTNRYFGSSNQFPNLSHLHIEEISRGAHKLNQILKACSNGLNVNGFSIEVGKELMKGAMDLEESLRMLVNLQETSEYMVRSQRKNRITLLDEDEDDEDNAVKLDEQKQIDLPRFSFDKGSRHGRKIQEVGRTGFMQKMTAALTYTTEGSSFNREKQGKITSSPSVTQRQSVSYSSGIKNPSAESKESKPEKERIPNVIAKLMGLNELPKNENVKHNVHEDLSSKSKTESRTREQTMRERSKISGVKTKDPLMPNTTFVLQAEKNMLPNNVSLELVVHDGTSQWKDPEGFKPVARSEKATIKSDKQQKTTQSVKPNKVVVHSSSEARLVTQGKTEFKEIRVQTEKQNGNKIPLRNQHKSPNNHELQQQSMFLKSETLEDKRGREMKEQQSPQPKLPARKQRGGEIISRTKSTGAVDLQKKQTLADQARLHRKNTREVAGAVQPKGVPNGRFHENLVRSKSSSDLNFGTNNSSPKYLDPEPSKEKFGTPLAMEERPVHAAPPLQKAKSRRVNKNEMPRRIDEVATRRSHEKLGSQNATEKVRASRLKQAEPRIVKSNKSRASIQSVDSKQNLHKEAKLEAPTLCDPNEVECRSLEKPQTLLPNESVMPYDQQDQAPFFDYDECITASTTLNVAGNREAGLDICYPEVREQHKAFNLRKQEPLTESENHLKQVVIKSHHFLNTAEALFKLEIPFGILHDSRHDCSRDVDIKLTLECGYEVMKRKGRRHELNVHPNCTKTSISFVKIHSLDELVRQLHKDFETLKFYGRKGKYECEVEAYLPKMLENDMHNWQPDVNCMWDMGWDETMFAVIQVDEVVKDLERLLLNGLVDELTRDLRRTGLSAIH
ncbi:uncharacterized protein LOC103955491 isoform X1 [Pyrus x bretschneideri]|uniref:uncharacterized protein LOC103955491 isoform X1 n=1 Tax=Pyrus x bretschneideri TaxID=225117 RepID=UPI000870B0A3|nr:uncharacterized protein LOC103955491 isoform X1 [Pyrus x bretschneideri]